MTIFHTTDLHFNQSWFEQIFKKQKEYDIFCITGDFLDSSSDIELSKQIEWISTFLKSFKKPMIVCSGNHDIELLYNENWLNKISNIYADNSIVTIDGVKFGSVSYLEPNSLDFSDCDVLLNHLPPAKTKTSTHKNNSEDWGDKDLTRILKNGLIKPKIILSGHLHKPLAIIDRIKNTTIYNCGSNKNSKDVLHSIIDLTIFRN